MDRDLLTTAAEILGLAMMAIGFGIWLCLGVGLVAGGLALVLVGYLAGGARRAVTPPGPGGAGDA